MGCTLSARSSGAVSDNGRTGTVTNTYYDSSVSNPSWLNPVIVARPIVGTGLTTAQMQDLNTFRTVYTGWDYRNVGIPSNSAGQSDGVARYPEFYWGNHVAVVETSNATRMYGDANTTLAAMIYGLKNYDTPNKIPLALSTTANQSSGVGTYAVTAGMTVLPPQAVGAGAPSQGGFGPQYLGMRINNGNDILWDRIRPRSRSRIASISLPRRTAYPPRSTAMVRSFSPVRRTSSWFRWA